MRILLLDDDVEVGNVLRGELEPLAHSVTTAPTVESAQVALQAESFAIVILSQNILDTAAYALTDYVKIISPKTRIILLQDLAASPVSPAQADWVLHRPLSALELVQVIEYLVEDFDFRKSGKRGSFSYTGTPRPNSGRRNWVN